ncbi:MAG: hypothetical protein GY749_33790 [Desulfobacteraceae bacterium]|nr:hypothetical protein [Desulfobacteraceae bacterium]
MHKYFQTTLIIILILTAASSAKSQELEDVIFLRGAYENPVYGFKISYGTPVICTSGDTDCVHACTMFSGNVGPEQAVNWNPDVQGIPANTPNDGSHYLLQSSIGWPTPATVGWVNPSGDGSPENPRNAAESLVQEGNQYLEKIKNVFYNYYDNRGDTSDPDDIYFAYDFTMSDGDVIDPATGEPRSNIIFDEEAANSAKQNYFRAWNINPYLRVNKDGITVSQDDPDAIDIRSYLLDIPYYQSVALILQGNLCLEKAFTVRFLEFRNPNVDEIQDELKYLGWNTSTNEDFSQSDSGAWRYFNKASQVWLDVFASPIQREYLIGLAHARTLTMQENPVFKTADRPPDWLAGEPWPPVVYDGYKDVAAMMRALAQRTKVVNEVARRLVLTVQHRDKAAELVEEWVQQLALEEGIIMNLVFADNGGTLPENHEELYPGLAESFLAYREAVNAMVQTREAAVNPNFNALGFARDIVLILPGSIGPGTEFTYDHRMGQFLHEPGRPKGILAVSETQDEKAKQARIQYNLKAVDYLSQIDSIGNQYDRELIAIAGYNVYGEPNFENPEEGGGLLEQQIDNVQIAFNGIQRVLREMENVRMRIEIERDRVEKINAEFGVRADMVIRFGSKEAQLTKEMSDIQAEMVFASNMVQAAAAVTDGFTLDFPKWFASPEKAVVYTANAFYQRELQRRLGEKQVKMVKLRTEKEAQFIYSDQRINDINSESSIKTWFLELRTRNVDLFDAQLRYGQELNRLAQYYSDIENIVMRRDRSKHRVLMRHFADPTFRVEVLAASLKAEEEFQKAQAEVYLTAKSLEYKWPLNPEQDQLTYTIADIIRARTAGKLTELMQELDSVNSDNEYIPGAGRQTFYWNFSLRKEYLRATESVELPDGTTLTSVEQFRNWLTDLKNDPANLVDRSENGVPDSLAIPFSTVKFEMNNGQDTENRYLYDSDGNKRIMTGRPIFDSRLWDDKIELVHVNIIGNNTYSNPQLMPIELWYGGSGFIRTKDSDDSSLDFISYPNINWFTDKRDGGFGWKVEEYRAQGMSAKLVTNPRDVPADVFNTINFRELPVAATGWRLLIPLEGTSIENIRDIEIIIIHKARTRPA